MGFGSWRFESSHPHCQAAGIQALAFPSRLLGGMGRAGKRAVIAVQVVAITALAAFVVHTLVPDDGATANFFDYRLYYAIIVAAALLAIGRAALISLHRRAWIALAIAVATFSAAEFLWLALYAHDDNAPFPRSSTPSTSASTRRATQAWFCCSGLG